MWQVISLECVWSAFVADCSLWNLELTLQILQLFNFIYETLLNTYKTICTLKSPRNVCAYTFNGWNKFTNLLFKSQIRQDLKMVSKRVFTKLWVKVFSMSLLVSLTVRPFWKLSFTEIHLLSEMLNNVIKLCVFYNTTKYLCWVCWIVYVIAFFVITKPCRSSYDIHVVS